ncbi:FxsA family protein, partial [Oleiphilus sp. HI0080]
MPILEMLILIKVGSLIGAWYTVALVLLTAII